MRCPKHKAGETCEVEEIHYGSVVYTVQKSDRELADKYGAGIKIVYRLFCITHSVVFSAEEYDKDGWKSCRCSDCLAKIAVFQGMVAEQQVPRWEPKPMPQVLDFEEVPF
ncbi:MAG: hypothetical protein Q8J63_00700 [Candidatus Aquicultor sp.]|nr:hypothetical protein [Candidatus Aquicultor sp.]